MEVVTEALSLMIEDWLKDGMKKTFDLVTEDVNVTKNIFCTCLDEKSIKYKMLENKFIIGNKKIYIYDVLRQSHL
ncbi:MAG: hypothetical protein HFH31_03675 [Bacilli bacterium]|nr:hypothetical protein [Bacilli bacterium]